MEPPSTSPLPEIPTTFAASPLIPTPPPVPRLDIPVPDLDDEDTVHLNALADAAEARAANAPQTAREQAKRATTQLLWQGRPIQWTSGRLALMQALFDAFGADSIPGRSMDTPYLDAQIFLYLATQHYSVWELPRELPMEGRTYQLPPLRCNFQAFMKAVRAWADENIPPTLEAHAQAAELMQRTLTLHDTTRPAIVPREGQESDDGENFP